MGKFSYCRSHSSFTKEENPLASTLPLLQCLPDFDAEINSEQTTEDSRKDVSPAAQPLQWKRNEHAGQEHACDTAYPENDDIEQRLQRRLNRRQDQQHQGAAAGGTMNHADEQWAKADVHVRVPVGMAVHFHLFLPGSIEDSPTEEDQHDGDREFEACLDPDRDVDFQENDGKAGEGQREGVTGAPKGADPAASKETLFFADKRGHRDDMVCIRGVFEPENETQRQDGGDGRFHSSREERDVPPREPCLSVC
jgi:hypothetical protein